MTKRFGWAVLFALLLSGCVGMPDKEGWHSSQKEEFLQILQEDKYASLCGDEALYNKVRQSEDSRLMFKLLVDYTNHLANSCIDIQSFKAAQQERKTPKFKTAYEIYRQKVDPNTIRAELKAGKSIEEILKPYIPAYREFGRLLAAYKTLEKEPNVDPEKVRKVRLSLERVKLMKPLTSKNYVLVNIPEFRVRVIEDGKTAVSMKVIVGKKRLQTPIFGEGLKYIVVNPQWNVPDSIARNEVIPKSLKNPGYLARNGLVIRRDYNLESPAQKFDPALASNYVGGKGPVPFKFIQPPSKHNDLGRVKFLFPNNHSVYMHDTQSKHLFKRTVRCYSHGCVRLERPNEMLRHIIEHYTNLTWDEAKEKYDSLKTHYITITKPLPVHTAYLTAYVEDDGTVDFFNDIYGYDRIQKLKK